ncbi:ABC transporter transmembrane domain-containing protein [Arthrobacter sp. HLT1-21]
MSAGSKAGRVSARLPKLVERDRRGILALLIGTGLLMAALAGLTAIFMTMLLGGGADLLAAFLAGTGLITVACGIGVLRSVERVLAERLGQSYIQQIRLKLVDAALTAEKPPPAGITIARATNDLTSVRNWVALGIAPLAVGIPMILGSALGLGLLSPVLALAALIPLTILAGVMVILAHTAFDRAKIVRRKRGRLASLLADTVAAAPAIKAASGERRELRRIGKAGQEVVDAAVDRSRITGCIRGSAAAAAAIAVAGVGIVGVWQSIDTATIAGALTIVGLMSAPVSDLGRVVEYRQNFKAARRILVPALSNVKELDRGQIPAGKTVNIVRQLPQALPRGEGVVSVVGPLSCGVCAAPTLRAVPGDLVVVEATDPARVDAVFAALLGLRQEEAVAVCVDGMDLLSAHPEEKRQLVGYAAAGSYLERGTVERAVRYRRPDLHPDEGRRALERVGIADTIDALPKGYRTQLRRGGEPLTVSERARLVLARASLASPPLLVLNRIDTELDDDGLNVLWELIDGYPGVVLLSPGQPGGAALPSTGRRTVKWSLDCLHLGAGARQDSAGILDG